MKTCKICDIEIEGTAAKLYCSDACRQKRYRDRNNANRQLNSILPGKIALNAHHLVRDAEELSDFDDLHSQLIEIAETVRTQIMWLELAKQDFMEQEKES